MRAAPAGPCEPRGANRSGRPGRRGAATGDRRAGTNSSLLTNSVMGGLEVLDPAYRSLFDRAVAVLSGDPRVISVAPGGSVATASADAWSDLDLRVVTREDGHDSFLAEWSDWLAQITPTVFARTPVAPFIINAITDGGLTFDVVVFKGTFVDLSPAPGWSVGLQRGFADAGAALDYAVAEQLRGMCGPFVSLVARGEHLRHLTGVPHLLGLLMAVFLAELDTPMPGKLWNATFTDEQLATVAALPPVAANRDALVAFGLGIAEAVLSRARPEFARRGIEWPTALARVTAERLRDQLGLECSAWLH